MARKWLRHQVDAQDEQVISRKVVVSPAVTSPSSISQIANGEQSMTPQQAHAIVERAKVLREARLRQRPDEAKPR